MKYINIVPIFNQAAPYIWSTFAHIQSDAMHAVYRYETTPEEMAFNISELNTSWHRFRSHFAFAAYDGDKMVGCVDGIIQNKVAGIHGLYVLPTYHKMGIGDRLLAASEHAASVHTNMVELTALNRARPFYTHRKYCLVADTHDIYRKNINLAAAGTVVPLFRCAVPQAAQCTRLAARYDLSFDVAAVNHAHVPMFVSLDENCDINGYVLGAPNATGKDMRVTQLCVAICATENEIARHLLEQMARMNIR